MAICDVCGNDYANSFLVSMRGKSGTFDSFECAIHAFAPRCAHCGCSVIGHGIEHADTIYCCAHCAGQSGVKGANDHPS